MDPQRMFGALAGWKWEASPHGAKLVLQIASRRTAFTDKEFDTVVVALNDRQLRSFARDLTRAAESRGLDIFAKPRWKILSIFGL